MKIPSGTTNKYLYFVAVNATDKVTRETGLTDFTVVGSLNGAADAAFTTPTVSEIDATTMPGVYALLVDEQTTLTAGNDDEELCLHITHASMAPVTRTVEIYRMKSAEGNNFVAANVYSISGDPTAADNLEADYDGTGYAKTNSTIGTCTTNTDMRGTDSAALASVCTETRLSRIDVAVSTRSDGTGVTLHADYDKAKDDVLTPLAVVDGLIDGLVALVTAARMGALTDLIDGGRLDLLIDAIKAKTDQLTFTTPNSVDATASATITEGNIEDIADAVIAGIVAAPEISRIGVGTGAIEHTYTLTTDGTTPIPGAIVNVYTDSARTNFIAQGVTNSFGVVTFYLDAGTYYFFRTKAGYTFTNPDTEVVS